MKRQNSLVLLASAMLVAMSLASCKSSNKPAAETSRIGEIPEAAQYIVGIEKYDSLIDYSQATNWLDVPAALVKDGVLDGTAADSLKAVDAKLYAIADEGTQMFGPECYHLYDYGFFFNNLKQNIADRIKAAFQREESDARIDSSEQ